MNDQFLLDKDQFSSLLDELNRASDLFDETKDQFSSLPQHDWSSLQEIAQFAPALGSTMTSVEAALEEISQEFKLLITNLFKAFTLFESLDADEGAMYASWLDALDYSFEQSTAGLNVANIALGSLMTGLQDEDVLGADSEGSENVPGQKIAQVDMEGVRATSFTSDGEGGVGVTRLAGQVELGQGGKS